MYLLQFCYISFSIISTASLLVNRRTLFFLDLFLGNVKKKLIFPVFFVLFVVRYVQQLYQTAVFHPLTIKILRPFRQQAFFRYSSR